MTSAAGILPDTPENRKMSANVCPSDWINPEPSGRYNLVVIGGGTAGLITLGDILDEIAEFTSEKSDGQSPTIEPVGDNRWQVGGDTNLEPNYKRIVG